MAILNYLGHKVNQFRSGEIGHRGAAGTPELGITEDVSRLIGGSRTNQGGSNLMSGGNSMYTAFQQATNPAPTSQFYGPAGAPGGNVLGAVTPTNNPTQQRGGNFNAPPSGPAPSGGDQGPQGPSEMDVINQEFDAFSGFLRDQENMARGNFGNTQSAIVGDRDLALTRAENERTNRVGELDASALQGKETERLNLSKVRQLLADLDQRNNARIAITGGGSSAEALADRFGRTAQQNVGGVLQEGQRFQNDVLTQKARTEQFYNEKTTELKQAAQNAINQARSVLDQNLAAINSERRASAAEKSRAKLGAWQNYLGQVNQARVQAASFQAQYDMWAKQMNAQMQAAAGYRPDPIQNQDFSQYFFNPQAPAVAAPNQGMGVAPTFFSGGIRRPDEEQMMGA